MTLPQRHEVAIDEDGVRHVGAYTVDRHTITVSYQGLTTTTQVGGTDPADLAEMLLSELVAEAAARPR